MYPYCGATLGVCSTPCLAPPSGHLPVLCLHNYIQSSPKSCLDLYTMGYHTHDLHHFVHGVTSNSSQPVLIALHCLQNWSQLQSHFLSTLDLVRLVRPSQWVPSCTLWHVGKALYWDGLSSQPRMDLQLNLYTLSGSYSLSRSTWNWSTMQNI